MVSLLNFICTFLVTFLIQPISSKQSYDMTECNATSVTTSASYLCTTGTKPCQAYTVYRTQEKYPTLSSISSLFNSNRTQLLALNNLTELTSRNLPINRELLIPIHCTCSHNFSHSLLRYNSSSLDTYSTIACETFEGLSKEQMVEVQNLYVENRTATNSMVNVPIRCACPDGLDKSNGTNYLVTYPVAEGDNLSAIAWKFNVSEEMIWYANSLYSLGPSPTIFPQTTLLIPTKEIPALVTFFAPSLNPSPGSTTAIISSAVPKGRNPRLNIAYIVLGVVVFISTVLLIVSFLFIRITRNRGQQNSESLSPRCFQLSNLSPDLLDDVSKLKQPLFNYSFDELKTATGDFSEDSKISKSLYRGTALGSGMVIKQVNSAEAHRVIEILTTINHINIVKLQGCCHMNQPYLVFELAANGSLRNCLSDPLLARQLTWVRRMEIAFDITVGLHYIHCCTKPCYVHRNINSRVILITADWRAKISGFGMAKPLPRNNNEKDDSETNKWKDTIMVGRRGYLAPNIFITAWLHLRWMSLLLGLFCLSSYQEEKLWVVVVC
ncbi:Protein kinase domain-containing protein [Cinnamomum micranthum f. kanehirae]|uniref:Protein kinase domain-containing protein n=1 Tax=Cinnamomum micranthum f. kanehirae TaxID=337451 RepID=A0A3S3NR75_9MAGN|nr:Protein kinase domain-containing protein [Cinnamomum micranthum f. kanehirae]